jgi:hypothetical protein
MIRTMQNKVLWPTLSAALLGVTLAGCGGNSADNTTTTNTDTTSAAPSTTTDTAPAGNYGASSGTTSIGTASATSFKEAATTWKQVTAANAALDKVIKSKNLKTVHEAAFKVRDIVKTLPAKSQSLSPDKQKTLASQVKNVEQLASKLDEAGDSNNLQDTQENQAGLNDALDIIKGLYPAGTMG